MVDLVEIEVCTNINHTIVIAIDLTVTIDRIHCFYVVERQPGFLAEVSHIKHIQREHSVAKYTESLSNAHSVTDLFLWARYHICCVFNCADTQQIVI